MYDAKSPVTRQDWLLMASAPTWRNPLSIEDKKSCHQLCA
jgi:hypothetical protein